MNEKSCTALPIIFVAWFQDLSSFSSRKSFLSNYYSLSFKERNVLVLILCRYCVLTVARGPQCCLSFAFFSALPCWLLSPPSLFWISRCKINSRFYYDNVFYSRLFSNWTTLFFNLPGTTYPRKFVATIYSLHMTHEYWPLLFL